MDSKDPDVHVLDGWMPATKTHPARTIHEDECDYLNGWIKKPSHTQKSHLKVVNPRDIAGERKKKKKKKKKKGSKINFDSDSPTYTRTDTHIQRCDLTCPQVQAWPPLHRRWGLAWPAPWWWCPRPAAGLRSPPPASSSAPAPPGRPRCGRSGWQSTPPPGNIYNHIGSNLVPSRWRICVPRQSRIRTHVFNCWRILFCLVSATVKNVYTVFMEVLRVAETTF